MSVPGPTTRDAYAAIRVPNFRRYIVCLLALTLGIQIQGTVVGWQVYDLTHDPLALGFIGLAEALPAIVTALYAGHVADTRDRRRIALAALVVLVGCSLALWLLSRATAGTAPVVHSGRLRAIYGIIIVSGVARAFLQPARQALSAELVPRELYPNAITWRSGSWQLAAVLGPAIGGGLYAFGGTSLAYAIDALLMITAVLVLLSIQHVSPPRAATSARMLTSLTSGLRFVVNEPIILGAMSLDLFSVLFGGAVALLPVFAAEILHVGPAGLGILRAAPAAGAVLTSIALTQFPPFERTGRTLFLAVAGFGLCTIGFGTSKTFLLSALFLWGSGACDMISVVVRSTLLQVRTPIDLMGRVSAVNQIFIGSSNEIGGFESGVTARWFGAANSVIFGGLATLAVVAVVAWRLPLLRRMGRLLPDAPVT
ncbi:MAG: MFS transporter [Gemmatimonadota bacterium]|nr:MFS transporter [Gemmatimonadota bacterium]